MRSGTLLSGCGGLACTPASRGPTNWEPNSDSSCKLPGAGGPAASLPSRPTTRIASRQRSSTPCKPLSPCDHLGLVSPDIWHRSVTHELRPDKTWRLDDLG